MFWLLLLKQQNRMLRKKVSHLQNLKYLLSSSLQKEFANR